MIVILLLFYDALSGITKSRTIWHLGGFIDPKFSFQNQHLVVQVVNQGVDIHHLLFGKIGHSSSNQRVLIDVVHTSDHVLVTNR